MPMGKYKRGKMAGSNMSKGARSDRKYSPNGKSGGSMTDGYPMGKSSNMDGVMRNMGNTRTTYNRSATGMGKMKKGARRGTKQAGDTYCV